MHRSRADTVHETVGAIGPLRAKWGGGSDDAHHDEIFPWDSPLEWAFVSSPTTSPNKSTMVDGGHIEFRKQNANISVIDDDNEG